MQQQLPPPQPSIPGTSTGKKRSWVSSYYDYDLATTKDTRGGFLEPTDNLHSQIEAGASQDAKRAKTGRRYVDPLGPLDLESAPKCRDCNSPEIDLDFQEHFKVLVCRSCKKQRPEIYSLLTKTEVRADYLLTESELRDDARLPVWKKPNPRSRTYHDMWLYLREHAEQFAIEKWGSLEQLDAEFARRERVKQEKQDKKYAEQVNKLRKATRTALWANSDDLVEDNDDPAARAKRPHAHQWEDVDDSLSQQSDRDLESGQKTQRCRICGLETTVDEL